MRLAAAWPYGMYESKYQVSALRRRERDAATCERCGDWCGEVRRGGGEAGATGCGSQELQDDEEEREQCELEHKDGDERADERANIENGGGCRTSGTRTLFYSQGGHAMTAGA